jgi:hypothetical protein
MIAAEYSFSAIVPVCSGGMLAQLAREYTKNTPAVKMYPRQRELLRLMCGRAEKST